MEDDEEIVRELKKLEHLDNDLFLGDVDAEGIWPGTKRGGKYGKRGRGSGPRGAVSRGIVPRGGHQNRSFRPPDSSDLNNFDNWDIEHEDVNMGEEELIFDPRRGGFTRGSRSRPSERREIAMPKIPQKSLGRGKPIVDKARFEEFNRMSDSFEIEEKSSRSADKSANERSTDRGWIRDPREAAAYGRQLSVNEPGDADKPGFTVHRKDPRLGKQLEPELKDPRLNADNSRKDPRLASLQQRSKPEDGLQIPYEMLLKDPRLMAQQVEKLRKEKEGVEREIAVKLAQVKAAENRGFSALRGDPRKPPPGRDFNKLPEKTLFEKLNISSGLLGNQIPGLGLDVRAPDPRTRTAEVRRSTDQTSGEFVRRGPRSPSPIKPSSPVEKKSDRNSSPARKRERSPRSPARRGSRWERSVSPRSRHERNLSPRRRSSRKDRSESGDGRRDYRDRSGSGERREHRERSGSVEGRRDRRDRSGSADGRRERERSGSGDGRRERRDWSGSPRRDRSRRDRSRSPQRRRRSRSPSVGREAKPAAMPNPPTGYPAPAQSGYDMAPPPPTIYPDQYQQPPGYVAPSNGPPPYGQYQPQQQQQQYHYENYGYTPQPPYGDYPPPSGPWGAMYPDMSQPPPAPTLSQPPPTPVVPPPPVIAPPTAPPPPKIDTKAEEAKKEAAIKNEVLQQKQTLSRQREEYVRKSTMISRELKLLKDQEDELREENSRDNERILRENNKLQLEIQHKLKAINNVIDMLTGIIGDKKEMEEKQRAKADGKQEKKRPKTPPDTPPKSSSSSSSPNQARTAEPPPPGETEPPLPVVVPPPPQIKVPVPAVVAPPPVAEEKKPVFNYVHYDPEMHWCKVCDVFPRTAKEFLNHLHSVEHKEATLERKMVDMPWHKAVNAEEEVSYQKGAPTKRTPIRGLQFFISATSWYCKLCDVWIGDLHCASLHLKSKTHTDNYVNFTEQSPHWETDWLADREKAYERKAEERRQMPVPVVPLVVPKDLIVKEEKLPKKSKKERKKERKARDEKDGKKKKRKKRSKKKAKNSSASDSSSSSSSSDSSDEESDVDDKGKSIRVAMRNKMKALEATGWEEFDTSKEEVDRLAREQLEEEAREKYLRDMAEQKQMLEQQRMEQERYERQALMETQEREKFRKFPVKDDKMLREWMGSGSKELPDGEKQILSSIKDRVKQRQEAERERKRDERDRYYDKGYYEDGNRRRRRGESPEGRSGKRGRSRSPEERRWDKSRGKYTKRSPPRVNQSRFQEFPEEPFERKNGGEKKQVGKRPGSEPEEAETKFERQALEAAAAKLKKKEKKPATAAIPKSKLPFIGRMPIMKHLAKKKEDEIVDVKKPVDGSVMIGPVLPPSMVQSNQVVLPNSKPEVPPPEDLSIVQDMEIDDADSDDGTGNLVEEQVPVITYVTPVIEPVLPSVQVVEEDISTLPTLIDPPMLTGHGQKDEETKKPVNDIPLPKDFQEALNILFPGQNKHAEAPAKMEAPPPPQWNQETVYAMYPDYQPPLPEPEKVQQKKHHNSDSSSDEDEHERFNEEMSGDDLAMLGIDVGDMAAQSF